MAAFLDSANNQKFRNDTGDAGEGFRVWALIYERAR